MKPVKAEPSVAGLRLPSFVKLLRLARKLTVLDQATMRYVPFVLNQEQRFLLKTLLTHDRVRTGKGRQIGSSTVHALVLFGALLGNPGLPTCICADSWDNSEGIVAKIAHWARDDLGLKPATDNVRKLELAHGASVVARTALQPSGAGEDGNKESRTGRSKSFGIVMGTERSFWRNAKAVWAALTSASPLRVWDESTGAPGDGAFRESFDVPGEMEDGWKRVFIGVEAHEHYRADPDSIDDATWEELRKKYGFTRRDSAAWWWRKLRGDFAGDVQRMLREFPVVPEHMFAFKEGQHITRWREVDVVVEGDWNFYRRVTREVYVDDDGKEIEFDGFGEPVVLGVDTAHGLGGKADASALGLVGQRTGRVLATFRSNKITIPSFQRLIDAVVERFRPVAIVVESNGPGAAVWQHCMLKHAGAVEQWSGAGDGEVWERRDQLRDAIETGELPIGGHLVLEAGSSNVLRRVGPDGRVRPVFVGMDDVLSAVSFARKWIGENPVEADAAEPDREVYEVSRRLVAKRAKDVQHF